MIIRFLSFTDTGEQLARNLAAVLGGTSSRCSRQQSLDEWTQMGFREADALVYIGAAGIAVRAIAPYLKSKASDPAVVVIDENGRFVIPIASGHLGGANDLARRISHICGAQAVITTATDVSGTFAVDEWAKRQNCVVCNPEQIKMVSAELLRGGSIRVSSDWTIAGEPPDNVHQSQKEDCEVHLGMTETKGLWLLPRIVVLGIGCRRGTPKNIIEQEFIRFCQNNRLDKRAVYAVASIDRKQREPGLVAFCRSHSWELQVFSAQQLREVSGSFCSSDFVQEITGVDNVCERSAVLASGGSLYCSKQAANGVTIAAAYKPYTPNWRWKNE